MNRNFRLAQAADFKRVRRDGRSYAHPFIVLVVLPAEGERTLIGVAAGKSVGGAVERNRAKRLAREAVRPLIPLIQPGWKIILVCRKPILKGDFIDIKLSVQQLFNKAKLFNKSHG